MTTVEMLIAEMDSAASYISNQTALALDGFDITACRASTVRGLCTMINAVKRIDARAAASLTAKMADAAFSPVEKGLLARAIDAKRAAASNVAPSVQTMGKQTFATKDASQHYYTQSDWDVFKGPYPWKLKAHTTMRRLSLAGFVNPTEVTCTDIAVAVGESEWPNGAGDPMQLYGLAKYIVELAGSSPLAAPHLPFQPVYQASPHDLPTELFESAYSDEQPVVGGIVDWAIQRKRYSARGTNKNIRDAIAEKGGKSCTFSKNK